MIKEQAEINYIPSKYSKALNLYTKNYMRWVGPFLNCISKTCQYGAKYPIYKVLKAISKIFLLNQIEIIFLAYMIKQTYWDIKDKLIINNSQSVRDVVCYSNDQLQYKSLILYLMVTSYSVKFYLNQSTEQVLEEASKICPHFKVIFQNWAKKHANLTKRINPKTLNKVYQQLSQDTRRDEPDFNMIVDAIIQISPAYNPQKNDLKKKDYIQIKKQPVKKVKTQLTSIIVGPHDMHHHEAPLFSSSGLYDIAAMGKNVNSQFLGNSLNLFKNKNLSNNKDGNFLGSSFIGLPKYAELKDEQICEQFMLGLQEGQSQQNIILQDSNCQIPQIPPTSIINLSRGISITEKYFATNDQHKK